MPFQRLNEYTKYEKTIINTQNMAYKIEFNLAVKLNALKFAFRAHP